MAHLRFGWIGSERGEYTDTVTSELASLYQIEAKARLALSTGLPGTRAHLTMAPRPRHGWDPGVIPDSASRAAGLILLYPLGNRPHLVLTVRSGQLASHANQVSFPGGTIEPDETVSEAALREAAEEVGVDPVQVRVLGTLSPLYIPVSHFALHPVLGTTPRRPAFRPEPGEVGRVLEVSVETLRTQGSRHGYRWRAADRFEVPYFELASERVWGATAMVLAELIAMLAKPDDDRSSGPTAGAQSAWRSGGQTPANA